MATKTSIIIPLSPCGGRKRDNTELRYALRSIAKNFVGEYEVLIAAKKLPDWVRNIELIPCPTGGLKTALANAAEARPNGFLWWYDDCLLVKPERVEMLRVTPGKSHFAGAQTKWGKMLDQIKERLVAEGHTPRDYSRPHGPYWFDKSMVDEGFADWPDMKAKFPWESWILSKRRWPFREGVVRQYYGAFRTPPSTKHTFVNYADGGFTKELQDWMQDTFPEPSKFEKTTEETQHAKGKAVSFSLYGEDPKYAVGMIENVALCKEIYPDWDVVVHMEKGHYVETRLKEEGAVVIEHAPQGDHFGKSWRFETAKNPTYDVVIFRDADSRVNIRERAAVDEWLAEETYVHVMRDHRKHRRPVLAGMWGIRPKKFNLAGPLEVWNWTGTAKNDEDFLAAIWKELKESCTIHTSRKPKLGEKPFPPHEAFQGHVGEVITLNDPRFCASITKENTRVVLLSVERYEKRRARFMESFKKHAGFLDRIGLDWWKATPHDQVVAPPSFRECRRRKHWWAATCDHLTIMEESIRDKDTNLFLFEDDCDFQPSFEAEFWKSWCSLPKGWKAMRLGFNRKGGEVRVSSSLARCAKDEGAWMGANFWNAEGLWRAYDHFWHRRKMIIDIMFVDLRKKEPRDWYQPRVDVIKKDKLAKQRGDDV